MSKKSILAMVLMISIGYGCTQNYAKIDTPKNNASVEQVETRKWDPIRKEFWTTMLFAQLSQLPHVRTRFVPKHFHLMVRCAIAEYEKRYEIEYFEKTFGQTTGNLAPDNARIAYNITFACSEKQAELQRQQLLNGMMENPSPKNML